MAIQRVRRGLGCEGVKMARTDSAVFPQGGRGRCSGMHWASRVGQEPTCSDATADHGFASTAATALVCSAANSSAATASHSLP